MSSSEGSSFHRRRPGLPKQEQSLLLHGRASLLGLTVILFGSLIPSSNGQTLRRPRTCSLDKITPEVVLCQKVFGSPQTCQLESSLSKDEELGIYDSSEWFRNCDCGSLPYKDYYCPMVANTCHVPRWRSYQPSPRAPVCLSQESRRQLFSESIWPVLVVTLGCIFACLVCSRGGHQSLCFMGGTMVPYMHNVYAGYLLRQRPDQASFLIRRWVRRREVRLRERYSEIMSGTAGPTNNLSDVEEDLLHGAIAHSRQGRPHMLKLTTRIFREKERESLQANLLLSRSSEDKSETKGNELTEDLEDDVDVDFDGCMICFGPLCDGDRVGALRCNHVFHAKCLKTWYVERIHHCIYKKLTIYHRLRRRNVCPLCLCEEAAESVKHGSTVLDDST